MARWSGWYGGEVIFAFFPNRPRDEWQREQCHLEVDWTLNDSASWELSDGGQRSCTFSVRFEV